MNEHEQAFVRAFIVPDKQDRYLQKLASARHRREFLRKLHHGFDFERKYLVHVPPAEQTAALIQKRLHKLGAPDSCHVIAAHSELDGKALRLEDALQKILGMVDGVLLSCIPGVLAYFEGEEMKSRYLLIHPGRPQDSGRRTHA